MGNALDQVIQGLKHFQGRGIPNFSGQPVTVSYYPYGKKFLPNIWLNLPPFF